MHSIMLLQKLRILLIKCRSRVIGTEAAEPISLVALTLNSIFPLGKTAFRAFGTAHV